MIDKDKAVALLNENGLSVRDVVRYKTYAFRIKLESGTAVFLYDKGSFSCVGRDSNRVHAVLESCMDLDAPNSKVFVAYGHDKAARCSLVSLLGSWGLEPLCIDSLPTEGRTIIEQLEAYIPQANYGVVLITPDDIGGLADCTEWKARARQNVILELGMLFMKLGRKRVAIVMKKCEPGIEMPSDIDGVLRLEYQSSVDEVANKLINELNSRGYSIDRY